jgi:hypothetical protein
VEKISPPRHQGHKDAPRTARSFGIQACLVPLGVLGVLVVRP